MLAFIGNCQSVFQNGCPILHYYQQRMSVPDAPQSPTLAVLFCCCLAILIRVWPYLIMVFICISLKINNVEQLLICLFAIHKYSSVKCLFKYLQTPMSPHLKKFFLLLTFLSTMHIPDTNLLSCHLQLLLPVCSLNFISNSVFHREKCLILTNFNSSIFYFRSSAFGVIAQNT